MSGDKYQIHDQHSTYYCTFTVVYWIDIFTRRSYRDLLVDSLNYCIENKQLEVFAWVIMSNHIHLIARTNAPSRFSDFLRDFKKFTSKSIIKEMSHIHESRREWLLDKFSFEARRTGRAEYYKIWQDSNHAVEINERVDIWQKIKYIHDNPVRNGLVEEGENYRYSSALDYTGKRGLVKVTVI